MSAQIDLTVGQLVYSKSGRDKGLPFLVVFVGGEYAYLTDGKLRKFISPKKKKFKHIQPTNNVLNDMALLFKEQEGCTLSVSVHVDSQIRKALLPFYKQ